MEQQFKFQKQNTMKRRSSFARMLNHKKDGRISLIGKNSKLNQLLNDGSKQETDLDGILKYQPSLSESSDDKGEK